MFGWVVFGIIVVLVIVLFYPGNLFKFTMWSLRRSCGLTRKQISVGKHNIVYLEGGSGPNLLLLHGFGADKDSWNRFAKHFTSTYHVIVPDLPGFGESSFFEDEEYDAENQVRRLHDFVTAVKLDEFHLVGSSMGGKISALYAAKHFGKVVTVTLMDAAGVQEPTQSEFNKLLEQGSNSLIVKEPSDYPDLMNFVYHNPPSFPAVIMKGLAEEAVRHYSSNIKIFDQLTAKWVWLEPVLPQIQCKALIIWGEKDRIFDASCLKIFESGIKMSQGVVIKDCGHLPMLEMPDESARVVEEFIRPIR
ncbi:MAG: alpha/beta hydrolase [Syntrophomonadaceae bacterium]|nr:alpha/beta hydrolase [Syntrophomonadaceae bacterium]